MGMKFKKWTELGFKKCANCKSILPLDFYFICKLKSRKQYYAYCKPCDMRKGLKAKTKFNMFMRSWRAHNKTEKTCTKCGETKGTNNFGTFKTNKNFRKPIVPYYTRPVCKECVIKYDTERREKHREKINKYMTDKCKNLENSYVRGAMKNGICIGIFNSTKEIPQQLVDTYREQLRLKRIVRQIKKGVLP